MLAEKMVGVWINAPFCIIRRRGYDGGERPLATLSPPRNSARYDVTVIILSCLQLSQPILWSNFVATHDTYHQNGKSLEVIINN
ncbi:hypothetical protein ALC60_01635 [Trachymyrmex zeteki]|uniref:Uncharacterized protein n=1 Tax=Mycetomoellerius zeteki TaxID=64791 RepID=A0A151XG83_9HYME|nr:hypothetical protein ALC60_01635 [Trachymyrmex zeteki]